MSLKTHVYSIWKQQIWQMMGRASFLLQVHVPEGQIEAGRTRKKNTWLMEDYRDIISVPFCSIVFLATQISFNLTFSFCFLFLSCTEQRWCTVLSQNRSKGQGRNCSLFHVLATCVSLKHRELFQFGKLSLMCRVLLTVRPNPRILSFRWSSVLKGVEAENSV